MKKLKKLLSKTYKSPALFFVFVAVFFGGLFIILTPPLQTPDEMAHFLRAYQVSEVGLLSEKKDLTSGGYLPQSIEKTEQIVGNPQLYFKSEVKYDLSKTAAALDVQLHAGDERFYDISSAGIYSPVGYLPQAIGIGIGRLFDAPVVVLMYLARTFSLLSWVVIITVSIKLMPYKKWALVAIGLLPMAVVQAGSPGIDAISVGLGILLLTYVLYLRAKKETITVGQLCIVVSVAALMMLTKQVMVALLPLILLIPVAKVKIPRIKPLIVKLLMILVPLLVFALWMLITRDVSQSSAQIANGQDSVGQFKYLLSEPLRFMVIMFNTFFLTWGDEVFRSFIGNFGWVDTPLSAFFVTFGYIMLAVILLINYEKVEDKFNLNEKLLIAGVVVLYILAVCGGLYLIYSPVGFSIIVGIQGRYFLPVVFLLIPLLWATSIKSSKKLYLNIARIAPIILLTASLITLIFRYYTIYTV